MTSCISSASVDDASGDDRADRFVEKRCKTAGYCLFLGVGPFSVRLSSKISTANKTSGTAQENLMTKEVHQIRICPRKKKGKPSPDFYGAALKTNGDE